MLPAEIKLISLIMIQVSRFYCTADKDTNNGNNVPSWWCAQLPHTEKWLNTQKLRVRASYILSLSHFCELQTHSTVH